MNDAAEKIIKNYEMTNTTALAYIGDSVYEIYVRKHILDKGKVNADVMHRASVSYVKAEAQAYAIKTMLEELSEKESTLVKRARNKKSVTKAKNADPVLYKWATAFEALVGFLYLTENKERLDEIIYRAMELIEEGRDKINDKR